jgi:hypothetical protein
MRHVGEERGRVEAPRLYSTGVWNHTGPSNHQSAERTSAGANLPRPGFQSGTTMWFGHRHNGPLPRPLTRARERRCERSERGCGPLLELRPATARIMM